MAIKSVFTLLCLAASFVFLIIQPAFASDQVKCVQTELSAKGYRPGPADGLLGRKTIGAADSFSIDAELTLPQLTNETATIWCEAIRSKTDFVRIVVRPDQTMTFKEVWLNGSDPSFDEGVVNFRLASGQCSDTLYGDGRGESDCNGGRMRSQIQAPRHVSVGSEMEYYFEFFIPDDFSYEGDWWYPSKSRLLIAEWKRIKGIKNHVYEILLDNVRGVTFEQATCITKEDYGKWSTFSLQIKWSKGKDGYLVARCNDQIILERQGEQTVVPPNCASDYKLQCHPDTQRPNADILWALGPNFSGFGSDYAEKGKPSPFAPSFPGRPIELSVRNLYVGAIQ